MDKEKLKKQATTKYNQEYSEIKRKQNKLETTANLTYRISLSTIVFSSVLSVILNRFGISWLYSLLLESLAFIPLTIGFVSATKCIKYEKKLTKLRDELQETCEKFDAEVDVEVKTLNNSPKKINQVVETSNSKKNKSKTDESIK